MIYTVTMNPSIDYMVWVEELRTGNLHRSQKEQIHVGGKGINVSRVLTNLCIENVALGYVSGFTGDEIIRQLKVIGQNTDFIHLEDGISRINIKLFQNNGGETEINGNGPVITKEHRKNLWRKLERIQQGDILVLSGNVPSTLDHREYIYRDICELVSKKGIRVVVDSEGNALSNTLELKPFLVKPNKFELETILEVSLNTIEDISDGARKLQEKGAQNVLVSLGEEGALLLTEHGDILTQKAPIGQVISTVGAGDSMIAGFLAGLSRVRQEQGYIQYRLDDYQRGLKMGVAAGSATAFTHGLGSKDIIDILYIGL